MRTVNIEINKNKFLKIINNLDDEDKMELFNKLKKSLFLKRFNNLLKSTKTDELTFDEITKEVEIVRHQRYEQGKQVL